MPHRYKLTARFRGGIRQLTVTDRTTGHQMRIHGAAARLVLADLDAQRAA